MILSNTEFRTYDNVTVERQVKEKPARADFPTWIRLPNQAQNYADITNAMK